MTLPPIVRPLLLALAAGLLAACGDWQGDSAVLTARTAAAVPGPDCASCHGYPLGDINHQYHLFKAPPDRTLNGTITCLDCHANSIRSQDVIVLDTVYEDPSGEKFRTSKYPNASDTTAGGLVVRSLLFVRTENLLQHQPVPMPDRPGAAPAFQEYVTTLAHMNGKVDVVFDPRNSTPDQFEGQPAVYIPSKETCSAVACHPGGVPYSFGSKAKGLPPINVDGN